MKLNEQLKAARVEQNLTQEQLAEHLGVSRQSISNWENGHSYPDIENIVRLSDLYTIPLDTLIKGDQDLINDIQKKTDVNKSNREFALIISGWIIIFMILSFLKKRIMVFKLDNIFLNIFILAFIILVGFIQLWKTLKQFTYEKKSNIIAITSLVIFFLAALFVISPIIPYLSSDILIQKVLRVIITTGIASGTFFIFKHIGYPKNNM